MLLLAARATRASVAHRACACGARGAHTRIAAPTRAAGRLKPLRRAASTDAEPQLPPPPPKPPPAAPLELLVADAADFELSAIAIRHRQGATAPSARRVLAVTKSSLLPRLHQYDLRYLVRRLERRGVRCDDAFAVDSVSGDGIPALLAAIRAHAADGTRVDVVGGRRVGKSELIRALGDAATARAAAGAEAPAPALVECAAVNIREGLLPAVVLAALRSPLPISARRPMHVRAGQSIELVLSTGTPTGARASDGAGEADAPIVLARVDVDHDAAGGSRGIEARLFAPSRVVEVRVVPTAHAEGADAPGAYRLHEPRSEYESSPMGTERYTPMPSATHGVELAFANFGWLACVHGSPFKLYARRLRDGGYVCVRRPMYHRNVGVPEKPTYAKHLEGAELAAGLDSGVLMRGEMTVLRSNNTRAHVRCGDVEVAIVGREGMNRALHGDTVAVRLLPSETGAEDAVAAAYVSAAVRAETATAAAAREAAAARAAGGAADREDASDGWDLGRFLSESGGRLVRVVSRIAGARPADEPADEAPGNSPSAEPRVRGEVVAVLERGPSTIVTTIDPDTFGRSRGMIGQAVPRDVRLPKVSLFESASEGGEGEAVPGAVQDGETAAGAPRPTQPYAPVSPELTGQLLLAKIGGWGRKFRYPWATLERVIGPVGCPAAESEAILVDHHISTEPFSDAVIDCLPPADYAISEDEIARRLDLRHLGDPRSASPICSIDPPNCVDIDDALHARQIAPGRYEVGVHIADATHFIPPGSALDVEAASRGNTFYLVNTRVNMIPPRLAEDLASLFAGKDRLAFSVIWEVDDEARILSMRFAKSVINSAASLSYSEAQAMIDDGACDTPLAKSLRLLQRLSVELKSARRSEGALDLASPEMKFELPEVVDGEDPKSRRPTSMGVYSTTDTSTHSLIEEWMVLANASVAARTIEADADAALLRNHPPPQAAMFDGLTAALAHHGVKRFDARNAHTLAASLESCGKKGDKYFAELVRIVATRLIHPAKYFRSGAVPEEGWLHSGLSAPMYTHFTSPIRRYADQDNPAEEDAYILRVTRAGVSLLVPRYGFETFAFTSPFGAEGLLEFDEAKSTLSAPGVTLRMLDKVRVHISVNSASPVRRPKLETVIIKPRLPGFAPNALKRSAEVAGAVHVHASREAGGADEPKARRRRGRPRRGSGDDAAAAPAAALRGQKRAASSGKKARDQSVKRSRKRAAGGSG